MEVMEKISIREQFVNWLKKEERSWKWFQRQISDAAKSNERPEMDIPYMTLYYTLKGAYNISTEQSEFWNEVIGTDFK
jgi:hypothetical protein